MLSVIVLSAAIAAVPGQRAIYEVTDFVDAAADCGRPLNLNISGPDPICDLAPAFTRAVSSCVAELDDPWLQGDKLGCSLTIAPGTYELRAPLELCRAHFVRGAGGGHWATQTTLRAPKGQHGIVWRSHDYCRQRGLGGGSTGGELSGIGLISYTGSSAIASYGIWAEARATLRDVSVRGFTQGVRISADVHSAPITNANVWLLDRVNTNSNEHAGVYVDGGDTNAGSAIAVDSHSNCQLAGSWESTLGPCAGIVDSSFLGNTWVGIHTATNNPRDGSRRPGYLFEGASQRSVCLGCYAEGDQAPSVVSQNSNAVAGMAAWTGAGNWLYGSQINGLLARNGRDPGNTVDLALGAQAAPGTYIEMRNATTGYPVRLKHDAAKDQLVTDVANLGSAVTGRTGPPLPGWPRGSVMVPPTQYFSSGGQTIRLGYGVTDPPLPDATWPAGSRWERISASATGAPRTWVLGADGAWRVVEAVQ